MPPEAKIEISTDLLRALHRMHRQRNDLASQLERGPRQIKSGEAMVARAEADLGQARETLKKARRIADEKQMQLQTREQHIESLRGKLNTAATNKEFSLLKEQIAADEQANSVQSDEILESLEHIDKLEADVAEHEQTLQQQQEEHQQRIKDVTAKMERLNSELDRVNSELAETERKIPAAFRAEYQRVIATKGEEALAPVEGDSCGGCYQVLTTQLMSQMRLSQLIHCPNCNAFLYMPEDTRVR